MGIKIEGLPFPPTMNHRMIPFGGRLILSPDHRAYKKLLSLYLHKKCLTTYHNFSGKKLKVAIQYEGPRSEWFTKKGEIKKKDVENRHKGLLDVIMPYFDLDDSQIFEITIKKIITAAMETTATVVIEEVEG